MPNSQRYGSPRRKDLLRIALVAINSLAARASWRAAPLEQYKSLQAPGAPKGVRRFSHEESHRFGDGSDWRLRWEVDADPGSILSVDVEHKKGLRILDCKEDRLVLYVPPSHLSAIERWRHIVASDDFHGCGHLPKGKHLYHRVLNVRGEMPLESRSKGAKVALATKQLESPSQVLHRIDLSFSYKPNTVAPSTKSSTQLARRLQPFTFDTPTTTQLPFAYGVSQTPSQVLNVPTTTPEILATSLSQAQSQTSPPGDGLPPTREDSLDDAVQGQFNIHGMPKFSNSFTPAYHEVQGVENLDQLDKDLNMNGALASLQSNAFAQNTAPGLVNSQAQPLTEALTQPLTTFGWNWDFDRNTTHNPEFELEFPGGEGWLRLYKPYLKAHLGLTVNYSSLETTSLGEPHVFMRSELDGVADLNIDVATSVDFNSDAVMDAADAVINATDSVDKPLKKFNFSFIAPESFDLPPIKIFLGGIPLQVEPGFSCHLSAFHVGEMQGSLRVGVESKVDLDGVMTFDSITGLQTNFSARARDVKLTPPTWMIFTRHFELGVMLEPEVWLKGGLSFMKDMRMGMGLKPYVNLSIRQKGEPAVDASSIMEQTSFENGNVASRTMTVSVPSITLTNALTVAHGGMAILKITRDGQSFAIPLRLRSSASAAPELIGVKSHQLSLRVGELSASAGTLSDSHMALLFAGKKVAVGVLPPGSLISCALEHTQIDFVLYDPDDEAQIVASGQVNATLQGAAHDKQRRLQGVQWRTARKNHRLSWGGSGGESSTNDFAAHLNTMGENCDEKPLLYSIGVGVFEKENVANVFLPGTFQGVQPVVSDGTVTSDWTSGYQPILHETMSNSLSKLLPAAVCEGGLCNGELPGCKPHTVDPVKIPRISFKLSRQFQIDELVKPEMRNAFAYGLALLPEGITIGEEAVHIVEDEVQEELAEEQIEEAADDHKSDDSTDSNFNAAHATARRLDNDLGHVRETDTVVVQVTRPMNYWIDRPLLEKLIGAGAFNLLSDGREKTHGAVYIKSFELIQPDAVLPSASKRNSSAVGLAAVVLGCAAGGMAAIGVFMWALREGRGGSVKATYIAVAEAPGSHEYGHP